MAMVFNALHDRDTERGRLACAGLGLADNVFPFQQQRNRLALNRRRFFKAHVL